MLSPERSRNAIKKGYGSERELVFKWAGENRCQEQAICKGSCKAGQSAGGHTPRPALERHMCTVRRVSGPSSLC